MPDATATTAAPLTSFRSGNPATSVAIVPGLGPGGGPLKPNAEDLRDWACALKGFFWAGRTFSSALVSVLLLPSAKGAAAAGAGSPPVGAPPSEPSDEGGVTEMFEMFDERFFSCCNITDAAFCLNGSSSFELIDSSIRTVYSITR